MVSVTGKIKTKNMVWDTGMGRGLRFKIESIAWGSLLESQYSGTGKLLQCGLCYEFQATWATEGDFVSKTGKVLGLEGGLRG